MQPIRTSRDRNGDGDGDRISGLPEDVLLHILSFVTTRQAVQMSLLSKRWRHLWTCIPVLCFNENEFSNLHHNKTNAFHNFTDQVLSLRREGESIRKFYFKASECGDGSHVRQWVIDVARHRNLEELVIDISSISENIEIELPHCLSSCRSVRLLKLNFLFGCALKLPNDLNLYGLKSLHLKGITVESGSLGKLISNCHFLEDLHLQYCQFDSLIISGNSLKKLSILYCPKSKFKVSVPSLLSFVHKSWFEQHCSLDSLVSLVEANIQIFNLWCLSKGMITICEILQGIRYASSLTVVYGGNQHLCFREELVDRLPMFSNLTHLVLKTWLNKDHVEAIINLLERSPNLKTLILKKLGPLSSAPKQEDTRWTPRDVSSPFSPHLRQINMKGFKSSLLQVEFVKFLLRNTNSLMKMTIIPNKQE